MFELSTKLSIPSPIEISNNNLDITDFTYTRDSGEIEENINIAYEIAKYLGKLTDDLGNIIEYTTLERERAFESIVAFINAILDNNANVTYTSEPDENLLKLANEYISKHFNTRLSGKRGSNAIKNKIYIEMIRSGKNITNWVAQTSPISMGEARTAADESIEGQFSKQLSNLNPAARFVAQFLNSIGKDGIGIYATGIKGWSMILTYFHEQFLKDNPDITTLTSYKRDKDGNLIVFDNIFDDKGNPINLRQSITIPNLNWDTILDKHAQLWAQELLDDLYSLGIIPEDVYLSQSSLLSASTDYDFLLQFYNKTNI